MARDSKEYPLSPRPYFVLYGIYGKRLYEHRLAIEPDDLFTVLVLIYLPYLFKLQLSVRYCTEQTAGYGTRWYPSGLYEQAGHSTDHKHAVSNSQSTSLRKVPTVQDQLAA